MAALRSCADPRHGWPRCSTPGPPRPARAGGGGRRGLATQCHSPRVHAEGAACSCRGAAPPPPGLGLPDSGLPLPPRSSSTASAQGAGWVSSLHTAALQVWNSDTVLGKGGAEKGETTQMSINGQWVNTMCPTKHGNIIWPCYCYVINNIRPNTTQWEKLDTEGHAVCDSTYVTCPGQTRPRRALVRGCQGLGGGMGDDSLTGRAPFGGDKVFWN